MSKADTLLKKATFFERMALYSDRKFYLRSLAQAGGASDEWTMPSGNTDAEIKNMLSRVYMAADQWRQQYGQKLIDAPGGSVMGNTFPSAIAGQMSNLKSLSQSGTFNNETLTQIQRLLGQIAQFGDRSMDKDVRMAWYGSVVPAATEASTMIQNTLNKGGTRPVAPKEDDSGPMYPGMGLKQMEGHAVPEQEAPTTKPTTIPISKADQAAVAAFYTNLVQTGDAMPGVNTDKMNDGVLGKETRKALEAIKDHFARKNPRNARMSDQDAIRAAKLPGNIR